MRTQEQERAYTSYQIVQSVQEFPEWDQAKFKSYTMKFPSMVLQNGLPATLAFYNSKVKGVYCYYNNWLLSGASWIQWGDDEDDDDVLARICGPCMTSERLRLITREALAFGAWLKRATETLLGDVSA